MLTLLLLLTAFVLFGYWFYKYGSRNKDYFKDHKISVLEPAFFYGSSGPMLKRSMSQADFFHSLYYKLPTEPIFAFLDMRKPSYLIRDPELIKKIAIKGFDNFVNRFMLVSTEEDPILGKSLVGLKGHEWKVMRTTLSPAFTGSKMRTMFELVSTRGNLLNVFLLKELKKQPFMDVEVKQFFSKFSNDVIATCAFGIEVNSQENPENLIFKMGSGLVNFSSWLTRLKFLGLITFPKLMQKLKIKFLDAKVEHIFRGTLLDTMSIREEQNIERPDLINILLNLKNGKLTTLSEKKDKKGEEFSAVDEYDMGQIKEKTEWSEDDLLAQCMIFFLAGFETVSTAMSFVGYELALNPDIQERLQHEIDDVSKELIDGLLTYDALQKLKYLDMVVSETLRKWPPAPVTDRVCTGDTTIEHNGVEIHFQKGEITYLPIYPIHRDAKYYPNPELFDPERFSDERKHEINPMAYFPFGVGPRNCIGSRFALMELKAALFYTLKSCTFEVYDKTPIPLNFGLKSFSMIPDGGLWIRIKARKL